LSKTEKGYFKKYSSLYAPDKERVYLKLFDAIARQKEYDEESLKKHFREEAFIQYFSVAKNYLYNLILKSLRSYHTENDVDVIIGNMLRDVKLLHGKALYAPCAKLLTKAKQLAKEHERELALLTIYRLQYELNLSHYSQEKQRRISAEDYNEQKQQLRQYTEFIEYQKLMNDILFLGVKQSDKTRSKEQADQRDRIMEHPLLSRDEGEIGYRTRNMFYNIWGLYFYQKSEFEKARAILLQNLRFLEANKHRLSEESISYTGTLINLINTALNMEDFDLAHELLDKFNELGKESIHLQIKAFQITALSEIFIAEATGELEHALASVPGIERKLLLYKGKINIINEVIIYFNISSLYFVAGEFSKSLAWRNKMFDNCDVEVKEDILCASKIMNLINQYELGNADVLEFMLRSTYRYLYKKARIYKHEKLILEFIRKLCNITTKEGLNQIFTRLRDQLLTLQQEPYEKSPFYFDIISWLESKIYHVTMQQIVKAKAKAALEQPLQILDKQE